MLTVFLHAIVLFFFIFKALQPRFEVNVKAHLMVLFCFVHLIVQCGLYTEKMSFDDGTLYNPECHPVQKMCSVSSHK